MIEYVIANNPDDRILRRACKILKDGGLIAFTTDTNWVVGADPTSKIAVEKLYKLKGAERGKHFSLLCIDIAQASKYAHISSGVYKRIHRKLPGPYTFIFSPTNDLPRTIRDYRKEKQIGIRIPQSVICKKLVEFFEFPILTSSLTLALLNNAQDEIHYPEEHEEIYSYQIEEVFGFCLDMILDPGEFEPHGQSTVVDFSSDDQQAVVLRQGAGDTTFIV